MSDLGAYLPLGLAVADLFALLVGALTLVSLLMVWRALVEHDSRALRAQAVVRRRAELAAQAQAGPKRRVRRLSAGLANQAVQRCRRLQASQAERVRDKLMRSGFRSRDAVGIYALAKILAPISALLLAFLLVYLVYPDAVRPELHPLVLAGFAVLGFLGPDLYLANAGAKRRQALLKALPDGLDLLVICAEAGLSLDTALHRVAEEMARTAPELADELTVTSIELNFLPQRRLALQNLAKRVDLPAVRAVANTLIQTERYGTPLAHSLRTLSADFREQRMLRAEEKAARLPATLTVPMIVFILPTLFIVLIGPAILDIYDNLIK